MTVTIVTELGGGSSLFLVQALFIRPSLDVGEFGVIHVAFRLVLSYRGNGRIKGVIKRKVCRFSEPVNWHQNLLIVGGR